jgi:monoamine oxidase
MLSTPFTDPNLLLSYSYWKPGQYTSFSGYEKARQGNIHFSGEHCSQDFQGFMEGGASEGVRAAYEVLADLKKA